jgi:acyl dehydratase
MSATMTQVTVPDGREVAVGDELPALAVPLTASVIVAGAIASRDFMPVHHDRAFAQAQGAPDVFMNILTSNGYVSRFVTDWAGSEAFVRAIDIRLGAPAIPGTTLRFTGEVTGIEPVGESGSSGSPAEVDVSVALRGVTEIGEHVSGRAVVRIPAVAR